MASDSIPPDQLTNSNLGYLIKLIEDYATQVHHLPERLTDLHVDDQKAACFSDGWEKPIKYQPGKNGSFTLKCTGISGGDSSVTITWSLIDMTDEQMQSNMWETLYRLEDLDRLLCRSIKETKKVPTKLPPFPDFDEFKVQYTNKDGWGNDIMYLPDSGGFELRTEFDSGGKHYVFSRAGSRILGSPTTTPDSGN